MAPVETIKGGLRQVVAQLVPGTFQHWDELSRDQTANPSLGEQAYWVADYPNIIAKEANNFLPWPGIRLNILII